MSNGAIVIKALHRNGTNAITLQHDQNQDHTLGCYALGSDIWDEPMGCAVHQCPNAPPAVYGNNNAVLPNTLYGSMTGSKGSLRKVQPRDVQDGCSLGSLSSLACMQSDSPSDRCAQHKWHWHVAAAGIVGAVAFVVLRDSAIGRRAPLHHLP